LVEVPRNWSKALEAAGLNPADHKMLRGKWTKERATSWIKEHGAKKHSLLPHVAPRDLVRYVRRHLGRWGEFVESCGIAYPGIKKRRDWTKIKVLEEIIRLESEGHPLNYQAIADESQALIHQARKYFGSWNKACAAAGRV
jgi:hypothetical protein